ncbi:MAG TPA: hydroxymethylbilane synthase [Gemmatimonadales bacterium]|nr:hydroxymethylbilane synthase [Gemmatimonadales bacterium]
MNSFPTPLRIGTRGSALALWQTERVRSLLATAGQETLRVDIKTTGDLAPDVPLARIGSRALFTKQIDDALLERRIDLAVHSLKDLSTELPDGIVLGAVSQREDPRDALVGRGPIEWATIPDGAVIATSSLRRRAQLLNHRPDLQIVDLRGNVDTRLRKLDSRPEWSAIVLAAAGLVRLGLAGRIGERLSPETMLPAPGQGALAVTVRAEDAAVLALVRRAVHDAASARLVSAERGFLHALEGGCQVPVGAHAEPAPGDRSIVRLHGRVLSPDGKAMIEGERIGPAADEDQARDLGRALAEELRERGAGAILSEARAPVAPAITEP